MNLGRSLLTLCTLSWCAWITLSLAQTQSRPSPASAEIARKPGDKGGLTDAQARMIVKAIPSVDIKATLARWKFQEPDLVKLRQWSGLLVENPGRMDFVPKWGELMTEMRAKNPQLQGPDVTGLIQMVMSAAYEEAHKEIASHSERMKFLNEMKDRIRGHLTEARQIQALLRSQRSDPLSGSLIPLPGNQRTLQKCQPSSGRTLKLECREILVSTTSELEDYVAVSERQIQTAEEGVRLASSESQRAEEKRVEKLLALSGVAKVMYDSAMNVHHKTVK